ncbi:protein translocase subunit SecF [Aliikangiella coralliicola]|uniref:Protein-export membrane protein SecF n=1 Tax=Aliikangiella coralliicola TaxID=2592383 RepID=A0A545UAB5_9GAMM|nr:protein translocase subunit SecF [Aliikangiella coralliicola]TQV86390.1 protein translocase subunit SecF [Aliikangiella coralliicola]
MKILKSNLNIDFIKFKKIAAVFSVLLMIASIVTVSTKGLNFGLDFTGGTLIEVGYQSDADINKIKSDLNAAGFSKIMVQNFGTARDVIIRLAPVEGKDSSKIGNEVHAVLKKGSADVEMHRIEFVGASVGEELTEQGGLAIIVALIGILIYVSLRFEWKFALGSVAALAHDVLITVGLFSLIQMEFDLTVLAAVLAVIGYSLNDTIVVFDRIRENFLKLRKQDSSKVVNISLNQTLSRTIMTSITTMLVLLALFFLGGATIHGFATALIMGVLVGTYSSIYVASNVALALGICKEDLMPPEVEKEGADQEALM